MFDLTREAWIPVIHTDHTLATYSLADLFANAHRVSQLACDPMGTVVVERLLCAIHMRVQALAGYGDDVSHARELYENNLLDVEAVLDYLEQWSSRFHMADVGRPFLQDPILNTGRTRPIKELNPETSSSLFATFTGSSLDWGRAAIGLLTHCGYDCGGIKPGDLSTGDPRRLYPNSDAPSTGYPGQVMLYAPQADTLARTIVANSVLPVSIDDKPSWECDPYIQFDPLWEPTGTVSLWTAPIRRVRLEGDCNGATGFQASAGLNPRTDLLHDIDPQTLLHARRPMPAYGSERLWANGLVSGLNWVDDAARAPRVLGWLAQLDDGNHRTWLRRTFAQYRKAVVLEAFSADRIAWNASLGDTDIDSAHDAAMFSNAVNAMIIAWLTFLNRLDVEETGNTHYSVDGEGGQTAERVLELRRALAPMLNDAYMETDRFADTLQALRERIRTMGAEREERWAIEHRRTLPLQYLFSLRASLAKISNDWRTLDRIGSPLPKPSKPVRQPARTEVPVMKRQRRGRPSKPVIRTGGGLPDVEFPSLKHAAIWLRENGYPKATPTPIGKVCRGDANTAYGFVWKNA